MISLLTPALIKLLVIIGVGAFIMGFVLLGLSILFGLFDFKSIFRGGG